jgi:hypothetical protein
MGNPLTGDRRSASLNDYMLLFLITLAVTYIFQQYVFLKYLLASDQQQQQQQQQYHSSQRNSFFRTHPSSFNNHRLVHNNAKILSNATNAATASHPAQKQEQELLPPRPYRGAGDLTLEQDDPSYHPLVSMYGAHRVKKSMSKLPQWLQHYITWHRQQRSMDGNNGTKYVILTCMPKDGFCGGLSDRLRPLPLFLLFASMVPRVICIYYLHPQQLENFLQPPLNGLDWRCPLEVSTLFDESKETARQEIISSYNIDRCNAENNIVPCMETKINNMRRDERKYLSIKLVSNDVQSINKALSLFQRHSYVDKMPSVDNWDFVDLTGDIFRVMFEPIQPLAIRINQTMERLGLVENQYSSVHTRCRYPVYPVARHQGKTVDKGGGMKFVNKTKDALVEIMQNAVKCAHLLDQNISTIFFASDHDEATRYMISNLVQVENGKSIQPVGIDRIEEPLHMGNLEDSHHHEAMEYFSIFEDLLIMGGSKCVSHGVGSFGSFGAALAGNSCRAIHRKFTGSLVECPNDRTERRWVPVTNELLFENRTGDIVLQY